MNDFIISFSDNLIQYELISQKISPALFEVLLVLPTVFYFVTCCLFYEASSQNALYLC
jgi:precorrin-3B methylase